jgi:biopolymer transport protein ExbB
MKKYIVIAIMMSLTLAASTACAETGIETNVISDVETAAVGMTVGEIFDAGGWVMFPLTGLSLLTVALAFYFLLSLRASQTGPAEIHDEVVKLVKMGAFEDAERICEFKPCALSSIAMAGLAHNRGVSDMDPAIMKDVLEGAGAREADRLQGQTQYLLDIAVISPMMGLLGTVFGMLKAFNAVALDVAQAKPVLLAAGVSEALITTALGLMVGIPAMMAYAYFRRRASTMISGLEAQSATLFNAFCTKRIR